MQRSNASALIQTPRNKWDPMVGLFAAQASVQTVSGAA
jgi:hypothetical protein